MPAEGRRAEIPPFDPIHDAIDDMYASWRLRRLIAELPQPSWDVDDCVVESSNADVFRVAVLASKYALSRLVGVIPHAMPSDEPEDGRPRKQPLYAYLAAEFACLIGLKSDQRLTSRRDRIHWLATPDGRPGLHLPTSKGRGQKGLRKPRPGEPRVPLYPTPDACRLGFKAGVEVTEEQFRYAEKTFGDHIKEVIPLLLEYVRIWAKKLVPAFGTFLVVDGTYFASYSWGGGRRLRVDESVWTLDGWIEDDKAWQAMLKSLPFPRWAELANAGHCHKSFKPKLPPQEEGETEPPHTGKEQAVSSTPGPTKTRKGKTESETQPASKPRREGPMFFGRRVLLVLCGLTGLPVIVMIVPADLSEKTVFLDHIVPELARMKRARLINPLTLSADAGFRGNDVMKALMDIGIDPRIDLVDRFERWTDDEFQGGDVRISLLKRGHVARRVGYVRRTTGKSGRPLKSPRIVPLYQLLPVKRIDEARLRVGFGCAAVPARLLRRLKTGPDRESATRFWACGTDHNSEPCRAGADGILYWTTVTGRDLDTSVVTRSRPSGGRHFRDTEVVRFEVGPRAKKGPFLGPRGGIERGKERLLSGSQRTPLSVREHPNVKADFRLVRALIERKNGVLRRCGSLSIARGWKTIAAFQGFMSVLSQALYSISNMLRLRVHDRLAGIPWWEREGRLRLIAGYNVRRRRRRRKAREAPSGVSPPRLAA